MLFIGQALIYGDGSSQGIAHAETIADVKESLELSGNADELKQEFYEQTEEFGNIDYFSFPEVSLMSNAPTGFSDSLAVTGFIGKYGTNTDLT